MIRLPTGSTRTDTLYPYTALFRSGSVSSALSIDSNNQSLTAIRDAINAAPDNPGVDATIVTGADGAHLVLNARSGGSAGAITVGASGDRKSTRLNSSH